MVVFDIYRGLIGQVFNHLHLNLFGTQSSFNLLFYADFS